MLRHGQFRANKPESFVTAGPSIVQYLGFGEYEQWKHILKQQRRDDYKQFIERKVMKKSYDLYIKEFKTFKCEIYFLE